MRVPAIHGVSDYAPLWVSIFPADVQLYVFSYRPAGVQTRTGQKPQSGAVNRAKGSNIPTSVPWGRSNRYFRYFAGPHKLLELTVCYGHGGRSNPRVRRLQTTPVEPRTHRQPKHLRVVYGVISLARRHHSPCSADGRVSAQHAGGYSRQSQRGRFRYSGRWIDHHARDSGRYAVAPHLVAIQPGPYRFFLSGHGSTAWPLSSWRPGSTGGAFSCTS